ncbi:cytochrome c [Roseateles sp. SL47]|uniref:c-type cytochrome n=1 Tax=Roseateles sp. SL47 TaxID=2995138 RepID=UPI0022701FCB|nr:cytochrome c [Roseateles sp. SL47]WAC72710.1 cytochrome c [Roseateles sp. SL47]
MEPDILPQQRRENPDPQENYHRVPRALLVAVAAMVVFGLAYIFSADINQPDQWGDGRTAAELQGKAPAAGAAINGGALFTSLCAACHQATGMGLPGVFPPLAASEWVNGNATTVSSIVLYGVSGPLTVAGKDFNGAMPAFKDQLTDDQLAALLTYVRTQWGNASPAVSAAEVEQAREQHKDRTGPFAGGKELPPH